MIPSNFSYFFCIVHALNITVLDQKSSLTVIKDINLSHLHKKLLSLAEPAERGISIFSNQNSVCSAISNEGGVRMLLVVCLPLDFPLLF